MSLQNLLAVGFEYQLDLFYRSLSHVPETAFQDSSFRVSNPRAQYFLVNEALEHMIDWGLKISQADASVATNAAGHDSFIRRFNKGYFAESLSNKEDILRNLSITKERFLTFIRNLSDEDLALPFRRRAVDYPHTIADELVRLIGQIAYYRSQNDMNFREFPDADIILA